MPNHVSPAPEYRGEILLVDDSPSSLLLLSSLLLDSGYLVREATSGELALWTIRTRLPELILLDLKMPEMDGLEVCRRLKADPATRSVPVIFLSAQDETTDKVLGLKVGAVDFIAKVSPHEEILARIDTHITLARVKKALESERALLEQRVEERTNQIARGRNLLRSVIDSGPDWIYAIDKQYRFLLVNRNFSQALGLQTPQELIGRYDCRTLDSALCSAGSGTAECECQTDTDVVFSGGTIFRAEEELLLANGQRGVFETYKTPLREQDGEIYGLLCYRRDITQRLQMEQEKRQLEKELWQAKKMEAIGQLAGGIAHDFNNLLSLILGFAQFAKNALASGKHEKLDNHLNEITKAGTAGQAVVAQLLAFSRTDEAATEPVDPVQVVAEVADSLRPSLGSIRLDVQVDSVDGTPSRGVLIREVQVRQVITNLVINARDALAASGERGRINIVGRRAELNSACICASCRQEFAGEYFQLTVSDNGTGIAQEIVDKLFDPFFTTKDIGKGSGLGLPMIHGIVHASGGHIGLTSAAESGTSVSVYLPLSAPTTAMMTTREDK
jgi:PAS domain S-box-containing protein